MVCVGVHVYVCAHTSTLCVYFRAKSISATCLENHPSSALKQEPRPRGIPTARGLLGPYGVGAHSAVWLRRRGAQQEADRTQIFKDICYLSWSRPDIGRYECSTILMDTHISLGFCPQLCTPTPVYCIC